MFRFALFVLVAAIYASVVVNSKCPKVEVVKDFNFNAYGQGKWYEVARYPNMIEVGAVCGVSEFTLRGDTSIIKKTQVVRHKLEVFEGTQWLGESADKNGRVIVSLPFGPEGSHVESSLDILAYNDKYTINYICKETKDGQEEYAWVHSRTMTLSKDDKAEIEKFINDSEVLNYRKFLWPSFSKKDCMVNN